MQVAGVVTQPWAARGRSRKPRPSFVEEAAMRCGLPEERIFRPASAKDVRPSMAIPMPFKIPPPPPPLFPPCTHT